MGQLIPLSCLTSLPASARPLSLPVKGSIHQVALFLFSLSSLISVTSNLPAGKLGLFSSSLEPLLLNDELEEPVIVRVLRESESKAVIGEPDPLLEVVRFLVGDRLGEVVEEVVLI